MILSPDQVRALRLRAQHLHQNAKAPVGDLVEVVRSLGGVNAQNGSAMMLSLRARIRGLEQADVRQAIENHALARTWAMRGTIHLIDSDDLGWMVALLGPAMIKKGVRRRRELGLAADKIARGMEAMQSILAGRGPMTRHDLTAALIDHGIDMDQKSQAPYHLIAYAALKGIICIGPDSPEGDQTYCLASEWTGKQETLTGVEALARLAIRYLRGYGPADPADFASWSGLSLADAGKGWKLAGGREMLRQITVEGRSLWSLEAGHASPDDMVVRLLPAFDALILGYANREYIVPGKYAREVYHGGQTVPVILVNGRAAGVWRYERRSKTLKIRAVMFEPPDGPVKALVREEAEDVGRLFGLNASLTFSVRHPGLR